ncbi:2-polyprenyl-6-hydroxyphenyl methylase/3-demethylubiquinone-9 3-methyltransferase [Bradyrhizobium sp. cir1]|uniref:class I SAM-dependent methyltransferase n=1 Tax=Bradyrhizobium sp. cir1 TaxID=1445730 RepID=UPI0016063AB3|nr:class I SAM-dependent methyltransferase [Bradyrhizobium sp. cir1]MBB4367951.1 2-polyprenyl-6-hydroxyphenyl methylase/3-demethylubiquinone-9 3-methyltransferase [Bradyrhizobium sp. cir1]
MIAKLKEVSTAPLPCKICTAEAALFGVVDFAKHCNEARGGRLPLLGRPVYYHRCQVCGFLFTDAFDDWSEANFKADIYNDGYIEVDPDYREVRPTNSAKLVQHFFGARKAELRLLDYGGGDGLLSATLRDSGFLEAQTFDPFVADFARPPQEKFDIVTCFETLEHMPDPMAGIAAIASSTKEDGLVLFSTLVQPADFEMHGVNWWYVGPRNGHVSIFSRTALVLAWQHHGYQTASFNDNLHMAFRALPEFARHLLKQA